MKGSELIAELVANGCYFHRHGSRHDVWKNKEGKQFSVPRHLSKEVPTGTADKIRKAAGLK